MARSKDWHPTTGDQRSSWANHGRSIVSKGSKRKHRPRRPRCTAVVTEHIWLGRGGDDGSQVRRGRSG